MMKKLLLTLILGMIMSGPAVPILKSSFGIGSATAYARGGNQDDQGENDDSQDETTIFCPPGGCIQ